MAALVGAIRREFLTNPVMMTEDDNRQ